MTAHTHGPNFGRRVEGCPRCAELAAGAPPVTWSTDTGRQVAQARQDGLQARFDRAYAMARAQLDTCCQNRIRSYRVTSGQVRVVDVADCPRHGTRAVAVRPESVQGRRS